LKINTSDPQEKAENFMWLDALSKESISYGKFPLSDILQESLYYPASGLDGDLVKFLGKTFTSFICVDYSISREKLLLEFEHVGFRGYHILGMRSVSETDLTPNGWVPRYFNGLQEDPNKFVSKMAKPFCEWTVFERNIDLTDSHGPARFSFLFICGEGVATYQAIYYGNKYCPRCVAIKQPGTGFGFNWTDFRKRDGIFARSVMDNPYGTPEMLINGGMGKDPRSYHHIIWPEYSEMIAEFTDHLYSSFVVWGKNAESL